MEMRVRGGILVAVICAVLVTAGCATGAPAAGRESRFLSPAELAEFRTGTADRLAEGRRLIRGMSPEQVVAELDRHLGNKTKMVFSSYHGVQVEFTADTGQVALWYPGNWGVVRGVWDARVEAGSAVICYSYFNALNPANGQVNPTDCFSPAQIFGGVGDLGSRDGDVFNLMSGRIPYRLQKTEVPAWPGEAPAPAPAPAVTGRVPGRDGKPDR
jgi:hypothetical protein